MAPIIILEGEPSHSKEVFRRAGIVFVTVYGTFLVLTLWRLYEYVKWSVLTESEGFQKCVACSISKDVLQDKKLAVHISLALFAIFEVGFGGTFIEYETQDYRGYVSHIFALIFSTVSFCLIPLVWSQVLEFGGAYIYLRAFCRLAVVSHTIVCIIFCGIVLRDKNSFTQLRADIAASQAAISAAIHLILSLWMLTYGLRMYCYLVSSQSKINLEMRSERQNAITRILAVAITFSLCYLVRSICVTLVVLQNMEVMIITDYFSHLAWYLISQWIPFVIPSCLMLYVCAPIVAKKAAAKRRPQDDAMAKFYQGTTSDGPSDFSVSERTQASTFNRPSLVSFSNPVIEMSEHEWGSTLDSNAEDWRGSDASHTV